MDDQQPTSQDPRLASRRRLRAMAGGLLLGSLLGIAGVVCLVASTAPEPAPQLTQQRLDDARARWIKNRPPGYRLEVQVRGRMPGRYELEIRGDQVASVRVNGLEPQRIPTRSTWMVLRQFDYMQRERDGVEQPDKVFGVPAGTTVTQRAEFDPQFGYPKRYLRSVHGTAMTIEWETVRFEPLSENQND
ncbi:MAG: DUF6174 domain-containing protein [Planctomycetales bacterium]